jgi:hypothetical protein
MIPPETQVEIPAAAESYILKSAAWCGVTP